MLEVSISVDSKRYTLIQTVCNVFADVVSDGVLVPLPLGIAMSEQVANVRFVRRDTDQSPDGGTQNQIWSNLGLVNNDGTDVVAALAYASSPSFANPFVTLSDISGLGATWGNITGTLSDQTDLQSALDSKYDATNPSNFIPEANVDGNTYGRRNGQWETVLPTTGGALTGSITNSTATYDTEMAGDLFGVQLSADHTKGTTVEFDGLDVYDGASHMNVNPTGLTFPDATVQTSGFLHDAQNVMGNSGSFNWSDGVNGMGIALTGLGATLDDGVNPWKAFQAGPGIVQVYNGTSSVTLNPDKIVFPNGGQQTMAFTGFDGYATESWVTSQGYTTESWVTGQGYATESFVTSQGFVAFDIYNRITFGGGTNPDPSPMPGRFWFQSEKFRYSTSVSSLGNVIASESWVQGLGYAPLAGATFTGKVNFTSVGGAAGLNVGIGGTSTTATTAGDMWIATGGASLNYRDGLGTWRVIPNTGSINTFTQPQIIATTLTSTTPALRITNIATASTAHSLLVEDDTNPDSTSFIITNSGNVGIGLATGYTATQKVEVVGNVKADAFINGTGPTYNVKAIQAHSGGSDTHELLVSVNGSTYRVGMKFVSTP
jgi:hypothetical protein